MPKHKPEQVTIDAIEGKLARVELPNGTTRDIPLAELPEGVKEGDVITLGEKPSIDHAETARRRGDAQQQLDALNAEAPAGEINL